MLNQETQQIDIASKHPPNNNHNPLNDHDYCSPNKRIAQQLQQSEKSNTNQQSNKILPKTHSQTSNPAIQSVASTSTSPDPRKFETPACDSDNSKVLSRSYSNENLSDSSSSSSSLSSSSSSVGSDKGLVIAQDTCKIKGNPIAPKDTPSVPRRGKAKRKISLDGEMGDSVQQPVGGQIRAKRARQNTSVTDKSDWIMGDDQIDSVLSEHLDEDVNEKRHRMHKERGSSFDQYTSSDYSSSDAESDQDSEGNSDDDPDKLWCVCRKPHENKFMIQCDACIDWFHGHCVGVTKLMGDRFEKQGKEWYCGECQEKMRSGMPKSAIPKKRVKKEKKIKSKPIPIPGKRGRGRPRKSESLNREGPTRVSQRTTRKSSSSLVPKVGLDNGRLKRNLARPDARSESFDEFEDQQRLKELIKERKKEFFYKRHLAEQQKAAKRNELGLGRQSLTANLSDSLDSLATSTSTPNMNSLPTINIKTEHKERPKPNIVLQINTKKDPSSDQNNPTSRIVTTIVRSPKKPKTESIDPIVNDLFTAEPIQINRKIKIQTSTSTTQSVNPASGEATTSNGETSVRKRSNSGSSYSKNEKSPTSSEQPEATPKKKRKDSQSSTTPNGSSTPPIGSKHIAQKIKDSLETRSKQIKDLEVSSEKIEKLATEIEGQLNECFKEGTPKYLNKYRSLVFNLRDTKNQSLVRNVLAGEISPSRLVRMSPDEMASHELAKWRERENKHSIELIKRDAQMAAQQVIVKKTHKGEEVIAAPIFNEPDDPSAVVDNQEPPTTPTKQPLVREARNDSSTITLTPPPTIGTANPAPLKMKITGITSESSPPRAQTSVEQCWSGSITMPDIARFSAAAKPVSGLIDFMKEEVNENLMVCGRIAPDQVQGYIKKLRTTTKNQILVIQLFPLTKDDKGNFDTFFDYLYSRNRYGVIQTSQQILKDFYIIPIHENSSIPEILKPIKGPGIDREEPNCLLGLLVRSKKAPTTPSSAYTPTPISQ